MAQTAGVQTCGLLPIQQMLRNRRERTKLLLQTLAVSLLCQWRLLSNNTSGVPSIQNIDITANLQKGHRPHADLACCDVLTTAIDQRQQLSTINEGSHRQKTSIGKLQSPECHKSISCKSQHAANEHKQPCNIINFVHTSSALCSIAETYKHWSTIASHCCSTASRPTAVQCDRQSIACKSQMLNMDTSSTAASSALCSIAETYKHWSNTASHCYSTASRPTAVQCDLECKSQMLNMDTSSTAASSALCSIAET